MLALMPTRFRKAVCLGALAWALWPSAHAFADTAAGSHGDPVAPLVMSLAIILLAAKLGAELAMRVGQPAVLGELVFGVLIGNLTLLGFDRLAYMKTDAAVDILARLGVVVLLFEVGLESTVAQMMKVGTSAFLVATLGVIGPFALGWGVGALLLPDASVYVHVFLGATLTATSVGLTARVMQDLSRSQSNEARIVLGAAVIDDVLGLVILAVVTGIIGAAEQGGSLPIGALLLIVGKATAFLVGSLLLGVWLSPRMFRIASRLKARGVLLALGLAFCFFLSWVASLIELAPIVGAFAAGLILEDIHYRDFADRGERTLDDLMKPIGAFLSPIFFVVMGMRTDLRALAEPAVLGLAGGLTLAAIVGKQLSMLGVVNRGVDRLVVGLGMIPRGEVGLIFANIGLGLHAAGKPIIDGNTFSAVIVMVIVTTMVTPPALKWAFSRSVRAPAPEPESVKQPAP